MSRRDCGFHVCVLLFWAATRYKRAVTDAMGHAVILVMNVAFLVVIVLESNSGMEGVLLGFVSFAVIFNAQSFFAMGVCFPLLTALIMAYNKSFGLPGTGHMPMLLPGAKDLVGLELFASYGAGILFGAVYVINGYLQNKEVIRLMAASDAAVSMSRDVAGKLAAYDTAGAMAILESATDVDADLVSSYRLITTNLDKYRDFLPEALLQPPREESDPSDVVDVLSPTLRFETELQHRKISVMRLVFAW